MLRNISLAGFGPCMLAVLVLVGCNNRASNRPPLAPTTAARSGPAEPGAGDEHAHKPGAHGGNIVSIGQDNYHAEAIFEKGGIVRLYILGKDEAKIQDVEKQTLTAYARVEGEKDATALAFKPEPQAGDAPEKTSQFVGRLPGDLLGRSVSITATISIAGDRFRFNFENAAFGGHEESDMPSGVAAEEERQLYLEPGGKYTAADIDANGRMTASEKFKGLRSSHGAHPRPGDRICPISETKANPKFTWVIGGKTYEFCCPPCVDEFVKTAKEHPENIREPAEYIRH
jgi:YHS domain-containing protein